MDIEAELKASRIKLQDIATEINQLDERRQELLQELLKLDGEIRLLKRLKEDKKVEK